MSATTTIKREFSGAKIKTILVLILVLGVLEYFRLGPIGLVNRFKTWQATRKAASSTTGG